MPSTSPAAPAGPPWSRIDPARRRTRRSPTSSSRRGPARSRRARRRGPSASPSTTGSCGSRASSVTRRCTRVARRCRGREPARRSRGDHRAYVGIGMALTIVISFLLIIPIEPIVWLLALPSGLIIGYYANQRSDRRFGPWRRVLANGLFAGLVTGLTIAILLLGVKALFFFADNGYRDPGLG